MANLANDVAKLLGITNSNTATSTAAQMQQQLNQLQQAAGTAYTGTTWTTNSPMWTTPYATTVDNTALARDAELFKLTLVTLIANVGPQMTKRLLKKLKIKTEEDIDKLADIVNALDDEDADLDDVINEAVKEIKL